jgi:hypothetical protein
LSARNGIFECGDQAPEIAVQLTSRTLSSNPSTSISEASALSRLLVVTENYPQLKSDALFRDLMAQLEGTENRITVARNRYITAVQDFNTTIRSFPTNLTAMAFGYKKRPNFTVDIRFRACPRSTSIGRPRRRRPMIQGRHPARRTAADHGARLIRCGPAEADRSMDRQDHCP